MQLLRGRGRAHRILAFVYVPPAALVISGFVLARLLGIPFDRITRDAAVAFTRDAPFYGGYLSNLGGLLLAAASAIAVFTGAVVLRPRGRTANHLPGFLLFLGSFTALLLLTEVFMLHDGLLPAVTGRYGQEYLLALGCYFVWGMWWFRFNVRRTRVNLLVSALLLLAVPLLFDQEWIVLPRKYHHLAEDGLKFLGITGWSAYGVITSWEAVGDVQ